MNNRPGKKYEKENKSGTERNAEEKDSYGNEDGHDGDKDKNLAVENVNSKRDKNGTENEENMDSTAPPLRRVSSSKREAAKKFLIGLSESLPKMFDKSEDLPSSLWYQEEKGRIKVRGERVVSHYKHIYILGVGSRDFY